MELPSIFYWIYDPLYEIGLNHETIKLAKTGGKKSLEPRVKPTSIILLKKQSKSMILNNLLLHTSASFNPYQGSFFLQEITLLSTNEHYADIERLLDPQS